MPGPGRWIHRISTGRDGRLSVLRHYLHLFRVLSELECDLSLGSTAPFVRSTFAISRDNSRKDGRLALSRWLLRNTLGLFSCLDCRCSSESQFDFRLNCRNG